MNDRKNGFVHVVRTLEEGEGRMLAASSQGEEAQAYADGLERELHAYVGKVALDPDYQDHRRTIVDISRDGAHLGAHAGIREDTRAVNVFFQGKFGWETPQEERTVYRNITMRLETRTLDPAEALQQATKIHLTARNAGIWPLEGIIPGGMQKATDVLMQCVNPEEQPEDRTQDGPGEKVEQ